MITIKPLNELLGAEKYGDCANCGANSQESTDDIYKISFSNDTEDVVRSIKMCSKCMKGFGSLLINYFN